VNGSEDKFPGWETLPLREEILNFESLILFLVLITLLWLRARDPRRDGLRLNGLAPNLALAAGILTCLFYFWSEWGETRLALAFVTATSLAVSLLGPTPAVCILMSFLILRPWEVMEANEIMAAIPRTLGWMTVGTVVAYLPARRPTGALSQLTSFVPLLMVVWLYLGASSTADPQETRAMLGGAFGPILIVYFVILTIVDDLTAILAVTLCLILAVTGIEWIAMYRTFGEEALVLSEVAKRLKAVGLLEDPNDASALGVLAFPFAVAFALKKTSPWPLRLFCVASSVTTLVTIRLAQSRGALMALFSCGVAYAIIRMRGRVKAPALFAMALLLALPVGIRFNRDALDTELSTQSRFNYWGAAARMAIDHPLFGIGFRKFPETYDLYAPEDTVEWGKRTAHSSWALILAEGGFPGLFILLGFLGLCLKEAWAVREQMPELFCSLVGYSVAISFLSQTYYLYPYALFALSLAAGRLYGKRRSRHEPVRAMGHAQVAVAPT
jgi:hypothetical protein